MPEMEFVGGPWDGRVLSVADPPSPTHVIATYYPPVRVQERIVEIGREETIIYHLTRDGSVYVHPNLLGKRHEWR